MSSLPTQSIYGAPHDVFDTHAKNINSKLDSLINKDTTGLPTGSSTSAKQDTVISKLEEVITNTSNISISAGSVNLNVNDLEALQTSANASLVENNTKLDTIDASLTTVNTSVAGVASSVDLVQDDTSDMKTRLNEIKLDTASLATTNTDIYNSVENVNNTISNQRAIIDNLNSKVNIIDTTNCIVSSSALPNGASTEITLTATNTALATLETSQQDIITKLTSLDDKTIATDTSLLATSAKQDILSTNLATLETSQQEILDKLTEMDGVIESIKLDTRKNITEISFFSSLSVGAGAQRTSTTKNITNGRHAVVVGTESADSGSLVQLYGSYDINTSNMFFIGEGYFQMTPIMGISQLHFGHINNICANYVYCKVLNTSGVSTNISVRILIRD
jgi:hypothetical protein